MTINSFFDYGNTIVSESTRNFGLNPITTIYMGRGAYSRYIFHFPIDYIQEMVCNKTFAEMCSLKHRLIMYNAGGLDFRQIFNPCHTIDQKESQHAQSFDLILSRLPTAFDGGRGFDNLEGNHFTSLSPTGCDSGGEGDKNESFCGSTWFNARTGRPWGNRDPGTYNHLFQQTFQYACNGVYDNKYLQECYRKYRNGQSQPVIIGHQHISIGNENVDIDMTEMINLMITSKEGYPNYGFMLSIDPWIETVPVTPIQTFNLFTERTSTWFEPRIITTYEEDIRDDRSSFYIGKPNRLYFYSNIGGKPTNFMELPTCTVKGSDEDGVEIKEELVVKQSTRGVYYANITLDSQDGKVVPNRMFFDTWSNLKLHDLRSDTIVELPAKTLDFTTKSYEDYFIMGNNDMLPKKYVPIIYGINHNEKVARDNGLRKVYVECSIPYTVQQQELVDDMWYRIYIREGNTEIDAFYEGWKPVQKTFNKNYFIIDCTSLLPHEYYIDIRTQSNVETINHKNLLKFEVVSKDTNQHYS